MMSFKNKEVFATKLVIELGLCIPTRIAAKRRLLCFPGGHLKVPHLWPGQIPPPLRRRDGWTLGGLCALGKAGG